MESISDEARELVDRIKLGFVATVSEDCTPNLSPKGTITTLDNHHLVFAEIRSPQTIRNILNNPSVEINVVDPLRRRGFRFKGTAIVLDRGGEFDEILARYRSAGVKSVIRCIVKVRVEDAREVTSPLYDLGVGEDEIKERWKSIYADF